MDKASKHSAISVAAYGITSAINYAFGVSLSWFFEPRQYGVLGVAQSLLLLIALIVGSGFTWTAAHDLATSGVTDQSRRRIRMALLSNLVLACLLTAGLWAAYRWRLLPLGDAYRLIIPLVGLTCLLLSLRGVLNGAARGMYRFSHVALNLVGEVIIKAAAGWLLIILGFGVTGVMLGFAIGAAISFLHSLWIVRHARIWEGAGWLDRKVLADTLPLFAGLVGIAILLNLDVLGLKLLAPQNTGDILAGYYQAAVILARTPVFIAQALALVLFSYAAGGNKWQELNMASQTENRTDYVRTAIKTWLRLIVPGVMVLILAPQLILDLFFPDAYQSAADILRVSAAGCSMLALATLLSGVFQALGKRKIIARSAGIATAIQVLLLIWLVPLHGAMGAALSLVGAGLAFLAGLFPLLQPILREMAKQNSGPGKLATWLVSQILPHILLAIVLIWTPRVLSDFAWVTLCCAGIVYLGSLAALRPREDDTVKPTALQAINHFVQVLLGG